MRYSCPKCKRAFHLETHAATPCPVCGVMLRRDTAQVAGGASGEVGAEALAAAKQKNPRIPDEPAGYRPVATTFGMLPPRPDDFADPTRQLAGGGRDTERTMLDLATQEERLRTKLRKPEPIQPRPPYKVVNPTGDGSRLGQQESQKVKLFGGSKESQARRGDPSGVRVATAASRRIRTFAIQGGAAGALAAFVIAVVLMWRPASLFPPAPPPDTTQIARANRRVAKSEGELRRLQEENGGLAENYKRLLGEKRSLMGQMDGHGRELRSLKESMRRRAHATGLIVSAVKLIERRSDLERALGIVTAALEQDPTLADAHRVKGLVLAALGRPDEALDALEAGHEVAHAAGLPGDPEAMVLAGEICLMHLDDRDRAVEYYKKALDAGGDTALGMVAEARSLFLQGDPKRAAAKAEEAREADEMLPLAPLVLGEIAFGRALCGSGAERSRHLERADSLLAEAVRLDPNSTRACLMRGRVLLEESRLAESAARFGLQRFDTTARADRLLSKANCLLPRLPETYVALAELRLSDGAFNDPARARDFAQEAVRLSKRKNVNALATLAAAQAATGDPVKAAGTIEEALRADPQNDRLRSALREYEQSARALVP